MAGRRGRQTGDAAQDHRWPGAIGREPADGHPGPVTALLALTGAVLAAHADGSVLVHPASPGAVPMLGPAWSLCHLDPPAIWLAYCNGELLAATGMRLARVTPDGTVLAPVELDAPAAAVVARNGRVHALAGDGVFTLERAGDGWRTVHRTPLPLPGGYDLDIDRRGRYAAVCQRPDRTCVVELGTGTVVGHGDLPASAHEVQELSLRFSPISDNLYRAGSRMHTIEKLATLGRSGRTMGLKHRLSQLSAWCTPLSSSVDGNFLASRQSGVGVRVWDLRTEQVVVFAELDDAPYEDKFDRRARRVAVAAEPVGQSAFKITKWATAPEFDGAATTVAVAPGAEYAVTGGRDGVLTVIDNSTRRIERSDGRVRQPGCLSARIPVTTSLASAFAGNQWIGVAADGTVTVVDLAVGQVHTPGTVDVAGLRYPTLRVDGDDLVLVDGQGARAVDRHTLAPIWREDDPFPGWEGFSYSASQLWAVESPDTTTRRIHGYQPRTGERTLGPLVRLDGPGRVQAVMPIPSGRYYLHEYSQSASRTHWRMVLPDGTLGDGLPHRVHILDETHAFQTEDAGWWVAPLDNPSEPVVVVTGVDARLGSDSHADLGAGMVVSREPHTMRINVWTLAGTPVVCWDAVTESGLDRYTFACGALWVESETEQRRLDLP